MGSIEQEPTLFQPVRVGNITLSHRIVLAPLTRFRADEAHVPTDMMVDYYAQRASVPGTLLIAEATFLHARGGGADQVPGVWSDEQIKGWKRVTDAVHARGSFIFLQIWGLGRIAHPKVLAGPDSISNPGGPYPYVGASNKPLSDRPETDPAPRPLSHEEILEYIQFFRQAAVNAVHGAGFDGVEIHVVNGFLIDQFIQDVSNNRTDAWGGSIEKRARFALEITKSIVGEIGEERTGIRLSPWNTWQDMRMDDPEPTFSYLVSKIRQLYPKFAYLHVIEPRIAGTVDRDALESESNNFLRDIWVTPESKSNGSVYISAGGFSRSEAISTSQKTGELVAFGRYFISNPDLPARIKKNIPLAPYDRSAFYTPGNPKGYSDYEFADAETESNYKTSIITRV